MAPAERAYEAPSEDAAGSMEFDEPPDATAPDPAYDEPEAESEAGEDDDERR
jgi:hypothetical protein